MAISDTIQTSETDKLDRGRFREFLHNAFDMTDDILLDRIFKYFDSDNDGYIGKEEWIVGLSVFLKGKHYNLSMINQKAMGGVHSFLLQL